MNEYEAKFNNAQKPKTEDLLGTHEVQILSGAIPDMRRLGHVKVIERRNGEICGFNKTLFWKWGGFKVYFHEDHALLVYDKYTFFDKVRKIGPGKLLGQYKIASSSGLPEITGYFLMKKKIGY